MSIIKRLTAIIVSLVMSISAFFGICSEKDNVSRENWNTDYTYVFVHGLMGWGEYDTVYNLMPYWGMFGGDLIAFLNNKGIDSVAASVSATKSAWDRACELYAQLTGTVTDYGKAHSEQCGHERYGTDYTDRALIESWSEKDKINLLGHSFGGATVRMLCHLMAKGSTEEMNATESDDISGLFTGGKENWIYSVTALAAPHNGTSAYEGSDEDEQEQPVEYDTAAYDMHIDNALSLNEKLTISSNTYYFSIPCSMTKENENGTHSPIEENMESIFVSSSEAIGAYTGVTKGGYVIDKTWLENDGLVNTISATAPFSDPSTPFDKDNVEKGIWNVFPTYEGDHMSLQGGLFKTNNIKDFYVNYISMINSL